MIISTNKSGFLKKKNIEYHSSSSGKKVTITPDQVIDIVVMSNQYLASLTPMFAQIGFDIYESLGQRNLSGFVGEVFSKSFGKIVPNFESNPHGDGRPDVLDLTSTEAKIHFQKECCVSGLDKRKTLKKKLLAPFKYGGLEVKSSIGSPSGDYKKRLQALNVPNFFIGMPRIDYTSSITFWGHHTNCKSLIGLYYDYVDEVGGSPQILAVMYSELDPDIDWNKVSLGKIGSKKTSNTSLTISGREKLYKNIVAIVNNDLYLNKLKALGFDI